MTLKIDRVLRGVVVLGLVLSVVPAAQAQMPSAKAKAALTKSQPAAAAKPSGGTQEGIKIHGHWTIVVRDSNGKVETRREFENALAPTGQWFLGQLLTRQESVREWTIHLFDLTGNLVCGGILEPNSLQTGTGYSKTLTVNFIPTPGGGTRGPGTVELKGDTRALASCDIAVVSTAPILITGAILAFTQASVQPPITVAAGRLIEVTVVLSFS